jgi:predicted alpha/beta hydrolase family esterase
MKQEILIIHGGGTFDTYDEYINFLKTKEVTLDRLFRKDWKTSFQEKLGDNYLVLAPQMPNSQNARYLEWKIRFERIMPVLDELLILIGHSLGGIFLAKYLSENSISKKVIATILIAAPFKDEPGESLTDFKIGNDLTMLEKQGGKIFLYHSKDDPVVPYAHVEMYQNLLPKAVMRTFEDRQHFNQPEFPELMKEIQELR